MEKTRRDVGRTALPLRAIPLHLEGSVGDNILYMRSTENTKVCSTFRSDIFAEFNGISDFVVDSFVRCALCVRCI